MCGGRPLYPSTPRHPLPLSTPLPRAWHAQLTHPVYLLVHLQRVLRVLRGHPVVPQLYPVMDRLLEVRQLDLTPEASQSRDTQSVFPT